MHLFCYNTGVNVTRKEYNRVHKWAERHMQKRSKCFYCGLTCETVWSNIDHRYSQNPEEWQEICRKCHGAYDKEMFDALGGLRQGCAQELCGMLTLND